MSLIKCIECNSEISDRASSCPKCGCPIEYSIITEVVDKDNDKEQKEEQIELQSELKKNF